jgi:hypothetical protein
VADLYAPRTDYIDADPVVGSFAAADALRIENGIELLDVAVDAVEDRVTALEVNTPGSGTGANALSGPSSARPVPAKGVIFLDETLGYYIGGYGSEWKKLDGSAITVGGNPGPGTGTAPTGMTAVVQPDNSIVLNWTGVVGATKYKLYESRSPTGVAGADNITVTTSVRTPSTLGPYEYWVTAFVNNIESAASNHALCSLPYGTEPAPPGGGGGGGGDPTGSPAEILGLGAGGGYWNLGVGYPSGHKDISYADLINGWQESPYFYTTSDGAVHFQVPMNGGRTTANTKYPRVEFRELKSDGVTKASWSGASGTHLLAGRTKMVHFAPQKQEMVVAQVHDAEDDTLQLRIEGTTWRLSVNGTVQSSSLGTFSTGTYVDWEIKIVNGTLTVKINGTVKHTSSPGWGSGQYFKTGAYPQQNQADSGNPASEYASIEMPGPIVCTHS